MCRFTTVAVGLLLSWTVAAARAESNWPIKVDPPAEKFEIKPPADWAIPMPGRSSGKIGAMLRPATPSRYVLVGLGLGVSPVAAWDLVDRKRIGEMQADLAFGPPSAALSTDGRHLLTYHAPKVEVWNIETGKKVRWYGKDVYGMSYMAFRNKDEVLVRWDPVDRARLTILSLVEKGEKSLVFPEDVDEGSFAISPGGKYLVALKTNGNEMYFADLDERKVLGSVDLGKPDGSFWHTAKGAAFSHDGTELAMLFESGKQELVVFDVATGKRLPGIPVAQREGGRPPAFHDRLQWMPDGSGWLVHGVGLIDRNSSALVWAYTYHPQGYPQLVGIDHLMIVSGTRETAVAQPHRIPWKEIEQLGKDAEVGTNALVGKNAAVSLEITVGDVRLSDKEKVTATIRTSLEQRLKELGFVLREDAPCVCRVTYGESAGPELTIQKASKFDPFSLPGVRRPPMIPSFRFPIPENAADAKSFGSGVLISTEGHVLTCEHVVGKAKKVRVVAGGGKYEADVLATDSVKDLALLKIVRSDKDKDQAKDKPVFKPLVLAQGDKAEVGAEVRAFGYPLSSETSATLTVSKGTVSGWAKRGKHEVLQVDAAVNPGNSGGPLLDEYGNVAGINVAKIVGEAVDNVGFSVPVGLLREFLDKQKLKLASSTATEKLEGPALVKRSADSICLIVASVSGVPDAPETRRDETGEAEGMPKSDEPVKVFSTAFKGSAQLVNKQSNKGVWFWNWGNDGRSVFLFGRPATEQGLRDYAFDNFLREVKTMTGPKYISQDDPPRVFPGETNFGSVPAIAAKEDAAALPKKATKRGQE
jgi:S1-C subfamily serine protease